MMTRLEDDKLQNVLNIISQHKGLPFLELVNESHFDEQSLRKMLEELESMKLIEVSRRGDVLKEYVSLRPSAIAAGA